MIRKLLLVIGPESSGTRWMAGVLSQHPMIHGPDGDHEDPLDRFWRQETDQIELTGLEERCEVVLTRRSVPASMKDDEPAVYMRFDDLSRLSRECDRLGIEIVVLITTRSPLANVSSWTTSRVSVGSSEHRARLQYHAAYRHLFEWLREDSEFWFVSLEGAIFEGATYFLSLFDLLGLSREEVNIATDFAVNARQYDQWRRKRETGVELGRAYKVRAGSSGTRFLSKGWAPPETNHVWTIGETSELVLAIDSGLFSRLTKGLYLDLELKPWIHPELRREQHLAVLANGEPVFVKALSSSQRISMHIRFEVLRREMPLRVTLSHPDAVAPGSLGIDSTEQKVIAFAIYELELRVPEDAQA